MLCAECHAKGARVKSNRCTTMQTHVHTFMRHTMAVLSRVHFFLSSFLTFFFSLPFLCLPVVLFLREVSRYRASSRLLSFYSRIHRRGKSLSQSSSSSSSSSKGTTRNKLMARSEWARVDIPRTFHSSTSINSIERVYLVKCGHSRTY